MTVETFFEKFELFADAPDAVQKMRELIVHLAVQGRLVEQDADDQPAAELLTELLVERAKTIAAREFPKLREPAPVEADDAPFEIPASWCWVRLGSLCRVQAGFAFSSAAFVHGSGGVPTIRIRDITTTTTQANYTGDYRDEFLVDPGDYLIGMDGNFTVARWRGPRALLNQRVSRLQWFSERLAAPFFAFAAQHRLRELQGKKAYTTVDHLSGKQIENVPVPLPPLAEQKRIVAKVDELMASCDRLENQQAEREAKHAALARASLARFTEAPTPANLGYLFHSSYTIDPADLRKSILTMAVHGKLVTQDPADEPATELVAQALTKLPPNKRNRVPKPLPPVDDPPFELPANWTWARFQDIAFIASNLVDPMPHGDMLHLAPDNIEKGTGTLLPCRTVREDQVKSGNHRFYPGQLVYSKIRPNLSKVVWVDFDGLCSADMYPIDPLIDPRYLLRYMLSEAFLHQAVKTDTRVAMPKINQNELNAIAVPVPPLPEQRRIVAKVDQLMALVDRLEAQLAESRAAAERLMEAVVAELTSVARVKGPEKAETLPPERAAFAPLTLVASYLAASFPASRTGGDRKRMAKALAIAQRQVGIDFGWYDYREAAGPHNPELVNRIELEASDLGWMRVTPRPWKDKTVYEYKAAPLPPDAAAQLAAQFGQQMAELKRLTRLLSQWTSRQGELYATVHAVWNDLLIDGREPTEAAIVEGVRHWSREKGQKYDRAEIADGIAALRRLKLVPWGFGPRTRERSAATSAA